jgi:hypothetical protein
VFGPDRATGDVQQLYELSLRQALIVGVSQEVADGQLIERIAFAPNRIVGTFEDTGGVADIRCRA